MKIDPDIQALASKVADESFKFVRDTTVGGLSFESVSQISSLEFAIAQPVQRLRNYAKYRAEYNRKMREKRDEIPCVNPMCPCTKVPNS